jgi:EAL domain-containing protein (putative c-di-GMP-specific phosphodiesterase class I)
VLEEACHFVGGLNRAGHTLSVSVNIAVSQLVDSLPPTVETLLADSGLMPELLCLELTESSLCDDQLAAVRRLGCPFVQGFLLSKPLAASELRALVRQQQAGPGADRLVLERLDLA